MPQPTFRNFPKLPTGVRQRIWVFASIQPHTHVLLWYPGKDSIARQYTLFWPGVLEAQSRRCEYGLLLANKESSQVVRLVNEDTKPVSALVHNQDLWINWDIDLLYVAGSMYALDPLESLSELPCSSSIRNLALSIVGHTQPYGVDLFPWRWWKTLYSQAPKIMQASGEWDKAIAALSLMTGLKTLKLVATSVFSSTFDPKPHNLQHGLRREMGPPARYRSLLDALPVGYNRRELRALASQLPRDTHGFTSFRLLSPSLRHGIRPLLYTQFTNKSDMTEYCRELCRMIHYIRSRGKYKWGTLEVCLVVDLDSNFNRRDFPDDYRRVGMRHSSREWYMAPDRFRNPN